MRALTMLVVGLALVGCGQRSNGGDPESDPNFSVDGAVTDDGGVSAAGLPVLGKNTHVASSVSITEVSKATDGLNNPRDLAFNPAAPTQLWVTNHADHSVVIYQNVGTTEQTSSKKSGPGSEHFMSKPSALAFGAPGFLATAQDEDAITQPTTPADFMGPTLFSADLAIFDGGHASHMDMLHNSPKSNGIAWDKANVYWVFDGAHSAITRYDFQKDHGLGGEDHTDGIVARYVEGQVKYVKNCSSHLDLDHETGKLYIADSGNNRIAVLDTNSGTRGAVISPNYDGDEQYAVDGATLTTLLDGTTSGFGRPSGVLIHDHKLFITDNASSRILAYTMDGVLLDWISIDSVIPVGGLMGLDADPNGDLYVVDAVNNRVMRIAPLAP